MARTPHLLNASFDLGVGVIEQFKKIPLVEIFGPTIQGEGLSIGQLTYFIRFGLCDYKCLMCDSMHAVDPLQVKANAKWLTQKEIFDELIALHDQKPNSTKWVTFTGGNPLVHDLDHLMNLLRKAGWRVNVETQGTKYKDWIHKANIITISPKGPSMAPDQFKFEELLGFVQGVQKSLNNAYFKFVVFDKNDLEFVSAIANAFGINPDRLVLSQGNNLLGQNLSTYDMWETLHKQYLEMFEILQNYPGLAQCKYLPQWHVWVWGNLQGV